MLYVSTLILLCIFSSITNKKDNNYCLFFFLMISTFLLCFRFGQGTDYFNYADVFIPMPSNYKDIIKRAYLKYNVEPFYYLINVYAKKHHLGFQFVIIACAIISNFFLYKIITNYSKQKLFSLFILFANYFFYFQSAIRQSTAMAILLYGICKYLENKKIKYFFLYCLLGMMFHSACIIGFLVPIILKIKWKKIYNPVYFVFISLFFISIGIFLPILLLKIVSLVIPRYGKYITDELSFSIAPIGVRFIFSLLAISRYKRIDDEFNKKLLTVYIVGSLIYFSICSIGILSRLTDFLTFIEVLFFPNVVRINIKKISVISFTLLFLYSFLFIKDLAEAPLQANYYSSNVLEYPYISIFNKEKIRNYKDVNQKYFDEL